VGGGARVGAHFVAGVARGGVTIRAKVVVDDAGAVGGRVGRLTSDSMGIMCGPKVIAVPSESTLTFERLITAAAGTGTGVARPNLSFRGRTDKFVEVGRSLVTDLWLGGCLT
jgi:hypothetical protein